MAGTAVAFFVEFPTGYAHTDWAVRETERHFRRIQALASGMACWWTPPLPASPELEKTMGELKELEDRERRKERPSHD